MNVHEYASKKVLRIYESSARSFPHYLSTFEGIILSKVLENTFESG